MRRIATLLCAFAPVIGLISGVFWPVVMRDATPGRVLRVAADPNNLPFTNARLEGFENRIAELIARELGCRVEYRWRAQRRGFFRNALGEGEADLVLGVPARFDRALTTRPYYRSSYVLVSRADRGLDVRSLDDPRLADLRIGFHALGEDGANPPPADALVRRGLAANLVGYSIYGDYRDETPPARLIEAVARGEVDVAIAWGPLAGHFATKQPVELLVTPIEPERGPGALPFAFDIALGVRQEALGLRDELDRVLAREREAIDAILREYGVPRVPASEERPERER